MHNSSLNLSDLVALQKEIKAAPPRNLKSVTEIKAKPLDQLPLMEIPQPPGGKREGAGRKKSAEQTAVVRVPVGCLAAVQQLIADYKNPQPEPTLKSVTEIKSPEVEAEPPQPARRSAPKRYRLVVDGVEHLWSGMGRVPPAYQYYMQQHRIGRDTSSRTWLDTLRIPDESGN